VYLKSINKEDLISKVEHIIKNKSPEQGMNLIFSTNHRAEKLIEN
jgi:hypothetical protein